MHHPFRLAAPLALFSLLTACAASTDDSTDIASTSAELRATENAPGILFGANCTSSPQNHSLNWWGALRAASGETLALHNNDSIAHSLEIWPREGAKAIFAEVVEPGATALATLPATRPASYYAVCRFKKRASYPPHGIVDSSRNDQWVNVE